MDNLLVTNIGRRLMMKYNINYTKIPQGSILKTLLATQDQRKIKEASDILEASEKRYRENK